MELSAKSTPSVVAGTTLEQLISVYRTTMPYLHERNIDHIRHLGQKSELSYRTQVHERGHRNTDQKSLFVEDSVLMDVKWFVSC